MPPLPVSKQKLTLEQQISLIFNNVERDMLLYYAEKIKTISTVQDFLKWFRENKAYLQKQLMQDFLENKIEGNIEGNFALKTVVGFWLGVRYATNIGKKFDRHTHDFQFPTINIMPFERLHGFYGNGQFDLQIPTTMLPSVTEEIKRLHPSSSLIMGINLGLHEGAHALGYIFHRTEILSEFATAYMTNYFGLPIKEKDLNLKITGTILGIRNFPYNFNESRQSKLTEKLPKFFMEEYLAYVFRPWLSPHTSKGINIFMLKEDENGSIASSSLSTLFLSIQNILDNASKDQKTKVLKQMEDLATRFYSELCVEDPELLKKLQETFRWIGMYGLENPDFLNLIIKPPTGSDPALILHRDEVNKFTKALVDYLDQTFGKPTDRKIPQGYAHLNFHNLESKRVAG